MQTVIEQTSGSAVSEQIAEQVALAIFELRDGPKFGFDELPPYEVSLEDEHGQRAEILVGDSFPNSEETPLAWIVTKGQPGLLTLPVQIKVHSLNAAGTELAESYKATFLTEGHKLNRRIDKHMRAHLNNLPHPMIGCYSKSGTFQIDIAAVSFPTPGFMEIKGTDWFGPMPMPFAGAVPADISEVLARKNDDGQWEFELIGK
jgi:hypothetical protein